MDSRDKFEAWYVKTHMAMMVGGKEAIQGLRNGAGYDDDHIDGAWEGWQLFEHGIDIEVNVKASFAEIAMFIVIVSAMAGLVYLACFSEAFYAFVMSLCESCHE